MTSESKIHNPICIILGCKVEQTKGSFYCADHREQFIDLGLLNKHGALPDKQTFVGNGTITNYHNTDDHIKINIEQSAKGARVTVTLDRADHDIDSAIDQAVHTYKGTIEALKVENMKVDEAYVESKE